MNLKPVLFSALVTAAAVLAGCTSNITFNTTEDNPKSDGHEMPRREVADQGSGEASSIPSSGSHSIERTTTGGTYLRRTDSASSNYQMSAGLHEE